MSKELYALLAKTLNKPEDAVTSLFNDDGSVKENAISELTKWDADRIAKIKADETLGFQNGYKKGHREISTVIEKKLKERFNIDTESTGDELIEEVHAAFEQKQQTGKPLTEDDVKKHPAFLAAEKKWKSDLKAATETAQTKISEFQAEQTRKERLAQVWDKAQTIVASKNPILPADPAKAKLRLQRDVFEPLKGYDYEINGDEIVILKDGKRLEDAHGHPVKFEEHVLTTAAMSLDFKELEDRRSPNSGQQNPAKTPPAFVPKNEAEYQDYLKKPANTDEEKAAKNQVVKEWNSRKQ